MHESGNEYWLQHNVHPSKPSVFDIDTNMNEGIYVIDVTMKYRVKENINRQKFNCNPNATSMSFTECAFNNLRNYGCSVTIDRIGNLFNETKFCKNQTEFEDIVSKSHEELRNLLHPQNESQPKCIRPCKIVRYGISLQKRNKNGDMLLKKVKSNDTFYLGFIYDDLVKDMRQEYLVMDGAGLISTVGGFLGLFLGSSCVSIIEWCTDQSKRCIKI